MNRDQLAARHTAEIRHHWRTLVDNGGVPPQQLLDDLAAIAEEYGTPGDAEIESWIRRNPQAFEREIRKLNRIHGGNLFAARNPARKTRPET